MNEIQANDLPAGESASGWPGRFKPMLPLVFIFILYFALRWFLLGGMAPVTFSDTAEYAGQYRGGFGEGFFGRPRPWGYPFFLWLVGYRWAVAVALQRISAALAWFALAMAARGLFRSAAARWIAAGGVLALSLTMFVIQWDAMLLSESLSISVFAAIAAAWAGFLRSSAGRLRWLAAMAVLAAGLAGLRDSSAPLLVFFAAAISFALICDFYKSYKTYRTYGNHALLIGLSIAGLLVFCAFFYNADSQRGHRGWSNIGNVLARRVFVTRIGATTYYPNRGNIEWLNQNYQLPESDAVERAGHLVTDPPPLSPEYRRWLETEGSRAWLGFLLHHPGWAMAGYIAYIPYSPERTGYTDVQPEKWKEAHLGLSWAIQGVLYRGMGGLFRLHGLNILLLFAAAQLGLLWLAAWFRPGMRAYSAPLGMLFWLVSVGALSPLIAYIGDDIEGWRHALPGLIALYLTLPLTLALLVEAGRDWWVRSMRKNNTTPPAPKKLKKPRLKIIVFAAVLLIGAARTARAGGALRLVLACDMPGSQLVYDYDARTSNVIYIIHDGWGGAIFDMHIFEDLLLPSHGWPEQHYMSNRRINADLIEWTRKGADEYDFHLRQYLVLQYDMTGSVKVQKNQVLIEGRIINMDNQFWSNCMGLMCLRCRLTPDFEDLTGERIFVFDKSTGACQSVFSLSGIAPPYPYFGYSFPTAPYRPKLQKSNQTLSRWVTIETDPCYSIMGNRETSISCIHSNVRLDAGPYDASTFKTTVTFEEIAGAEKCWMMYD